MSLNIRVSGQAEFSQIKREFKDLDRTMSTLQRNMERGAGKGFFSKEQLRGAQYSLKQLLDGQKNMNSLLDEQRTKIQELEKAQTKAGDSRKKEIENELRKRKDLLKTYEEELAYIKRKTSEMQKTQSGAQVGSSSGGVGDSAGTAAALFALKPIASVVGKILGMLGIGSGASLMASGVSTAFQQQQQISSLGMRIGGRQPDFQGLLSGIGATGLPMGYSYLESMGLQDTYSSRAGKLDLSGQETIQKFSRGFGTDLNQSGSLFAEMARVGNNNGSQKAFAELLAGSIEKGNMQSRAVEAMETTAGLMNQMVRKLPEVSGTGLLTLQALLNKTGVSGFMGEFGGDRMAELNNMFSSSDQATSFFVGRALGWGSGGQDWYSTQLKKDKGITDVGNLQSVLGSIGNIADPKMRDMALSRMTGMSLTMAKTFREETNNYGNITSGQLEELQKTMASDGKESLAVRLESFSDSIGGWSTIVDKQLEQANAQIGGGLIPAINQTKGKIGELILSLDRFLGDDDLASGSEAKALNRTSIGTMIATAIGGTAIISTIGKIASFFGGKSVAAGVATVATGVGAKVILPALLTIVGMKLAKDFGDAAAVKTWETLSGFFSSRSGSSGTTTGNIFSNDKRTPGFFSSRSGSSGTTTGNIFSNYKITSGFGMREHPVFGGQRMHNGIDFAMPQGTPLKALEDGIIQKSKMSNTGLGGFIHLKTDSGKVLEFGHLSKLIAQEGQRVSAGQTIASSGGLPGTPGAGASTGSHLHFGVMESGRYVDPKNYLHELEQRKTEQTHNINLNVKGDVSAVDKSNLEEIFKNILMRDRLLNPVNS